MRLGSAYLSVGFRVDATGEVLGEGGAGEGGTWRVIPRSKDVVKPELKTFRVLPRSSTFVVRLDNDVLIYLEKYSLDSRIYLFDFSLMPEIQDAGDYLTGIVALSSLPVEDPASLVVGSPTINMEKTGVKVRITGGVANQTYTITCRVSTHDGATLEGRGELFILTA